MEKMLTCPVCNKPLTQLEYDKALGLWKDKQEHIKHLELEQKKLKEKEKAVLQSLEDQKKKLKAKSAEYQNQIKYAQKKFKEENEKIKRSSKKMLKEQLEKNAKLLKDQKIALEKSFDLKIKNEVKSGIEKGVEQQKKNFKKQEIDLKKTKNKMLQLENSLKLSAKKYEVANDEIKKLKEQIERGITPQIEGLLEEDNLLMKLKELFPCDRFEHPGKGGDVIQYVINQGKEIGIIVYECKKVKSFNKSFIDQAKEARRTRKADYAILVTNAFPSKKQYYFVEKTVFVISPMSLEPIVHTLRESLVTISILKLSNEAKQLAVQKVYEYLSGTEYNNKMNDVANQLVDLAKDLKLEIKSHKDRWEKRFIIYNKLYTDVGAIDVRLKSLIQNKEARFLAKPMKELEEAKELI